MRKKEEDAFDGVEPYRVQDLLESEFAARSKAKRDAAESVKSDNDETRAERTRRFCASMLDDNGDMVRPTWMTVPWPDRPSGPRYRVGEHVY